MVNSENIDSIEEAYETIISFPKIDFSQWDPIDPWLPSFSKYIPVRLGQLK